MKDTMEYKGYAGSVHYSDEDRLFYGKVEFIRSLLSYEGTDVDSLRQAFEATVDEYLGGCVQSGREPEKPFRGTFNVRTGSELHRRAVFRARERGINLNRLVTEALEEYLTRR